ncbi:MAG: hypothetical protein ACK5MV_04005 [Aminipila sp.]
MSKREKDKQHIIGGIKKGIHSLLEICERHEGGLYVGLYLGIIIYCLYGLYQLL